MERIGFIGLGIMGAPMAGNLIEAGYPVMTSTHFEPAHEGLLRKGLTTAPTPKAVAEQCDVIIIMVPDTPQVEDILFGDDKIAEGLSKGKIVIDMSSISPLETKDFASRINKLDCEYLDAPVSGGEVGAKAGSLTIMVGGSERGFKRVRPILDKLGQNINLIGGNGDGQTTKVANQIIVAATIQAVGEALLFASKAGADPAKVQQALLGGFASSKILELHGERMVNRTFEPGFRISLHQKDLNLALSNAHKLQMSLPATALCQQLFNACTARGGSDWDHSAMVKALEWLADHKVASKK